jgi:hypothetical protein
MQFTLVRVLSHLSNIPDRSAQPRALCFAPIMRPEDVDRPGEASFGAHTTDIHHYRAATMTSRLEPDAFDSLAALSKFVDVQECAPLFYARHKDGIDTVVRTIRLLVDGNPGLRPTLAFTAAPVPVMASALRDWYKTAGVSDVEIEAIDRYVGLAVRAVLPVFGDPKLPTFLKECRWGVAGAFAENRKTA